VSAMLRNLTRTGNRHREWRTARRVSHLQLRVPRVLASFTMPKSVDGFTEALVAEDIGDCTRGIIHLGELVGSGQESACLAFEDEVIRMTGVLVRARIVDRDHHLNNIVVAQDGGLARLDFELARSGVPAALQPHRYGDMLGQLVASHAFAVQPHNERSTEFAARLAAELEPSRIVRAVAASVVAAKLASQRENAGIDTRWELRW